MVIIENLNDLKPHLKDRYFQVRLKKSKVQLYAAFKSNMLDSETEICWIQKEWKKIHRGKIIEEAAMLCQYQMK